VTPKEYRLLQILAQHPAMSYHQHLLREVWGNDHIDDTHYLRIFVRKLRRKIEADPTSLASCSPSRCRLPAGAFRSAAKRGGAQGAPYSRRRLRIGASP